MTNQPKKSRTITSGLAAIVLGASTILPSVGCAPMRPAYYQHRTMSISDDAKPYYENAVKDAMEKDGQDARIAVVALMERFDFDRNGVLDRDEAYSLYLHVRKRVGKLKENIEDLYR